MSLDGVEPNPDSADQQAVEQAVLGDTVEALLASLPPQVANAIRLGAIPHWLDDKLLGRLCGDEFDVVQVIPYLRRFSFVRQDAQGRFRYHDQVRTYLLAWWRRMSWDQYEAANRSALAHFRALAEAAAPVERPAYEREVLYHLLILDETAGLHYLGARFEDAHGRYQLGLAEGFVTQAEQLKDTFTAQGRMWVQYFQARLDLVYRRGDMGQDMFKDLADYAPDPILQAVARWNLGEILVSQKQWSKATRLYRTSLAVLQSSRSPMYGARVMLALGDSYCDLAESCGGLSREDEQSFGGANRLLHFAQHLPFLAYQGLVRRVHFLPNWFFGTNYQNWIIAYLLTEAIRWYGQAQRQLQEIGDKQGLVQARLRLGELEHQLGRWSRAHRRYTALLNTAEIRGSLYRTAQVRLGLGRALLDERALIDAQSALSEAIETFRRFQDDHSVGVTAALLGRVNASLDQPGEAISAYRESARAFEAIGDHVAATQVLWALEDLSHRSDLHDEERQQIETAAAQVAERHYVARFPDTLFLWFRRLALWGALPLTYIVTIVIALALTLSVYIVEGLLTLSATGAPLHAGIIDVLILIAGAALPVLLALWSYRFIYSVMGMIVVRFLGRPLIRIEREQPGYFVTDVEGLTHQDVSRGLSCSAAWPDILLFISVDYYQWQRVIHLISRTILTSGSGAPVMVDAITTGYDRLQKDILRHLSRQPDGPRQRNSDFVIFDGRWMLGAILVCLAFALYLFAIGKLAFTVIHPRLGEITLYLSSTMLSFVPTMLFIFPAMTLWRLVRHRIAVQSVLPYQPKAVPSRLLWLAAIICTVLATLWILLLATIR